MSSLSAPLQALVDLFSGPLQGVRFADIDGDGLSGLATEVESLAKEVEALETQLASYREALAQKQEALSTLAQQALAYARIYAENDEALTAELEEISLPRATKTRKGAAPKSPSERSKAPKDASDNSADNSADVGVDSDASEAEAAPPVKAARKTATAAEDEAKTELPTPVKAGRKKLPTRSGRASR